jgi:hypothetical protein
MILSGSTLILVMILAGAASGVLRADTKNVAASTVTSAPPDSQTVNLSGVWENEKGDIFEITQSAPGQDFTSTMLNDTSCTGPQHPDKRNFFVEGYVQPDGSFKGTLNLCLSNGTDSNLVKTCGFKDLWTPLFNATYSEDQITGQYRGEYILINGKNNCPLGYYYPADFTLTRIDCSPLSFEQLATKYLPPGYDRDKEIQLAKSFESGTKLYWTENQKSPGGFKEKVDAFLYGLHQWGYLDPGVFETPVQLEHAVNSAYRPIVYVAHFADLRICSLKIADAVLQHNNIATSLMDSALKLNEEIVTKHGIHLEVNTKIQGVPIKVPFVCYRVPLTNCPHVNEKAVDVTLPNNNVDWLAAFYGFCRPYPVKDPVHWEYVGKHPWGNEKCSLVSPAPKKVHATGESPVNLLLTDSYGYRIGYDPVSGKVVDDYGSDGAFYSGPGTHPQVIDIYSTATTPGEYSVSGIGTSEGDYTITLETSNVDGYLLDSRNLTGHVKSGQPTLRLNYTVLDDYSPASPWTIAAIGKSDPGGDNYLVRTDSSNSTVHITGRGVTSIMYSKQGPVLALKNDGSSGQMTVLVPKDLFTGPFTIRGDDQKVEFTTSESGTGSSLTFTRPAGVQTIMILGTSPLQQAASLWSPLTIGIMVAAVAGAALLFSLFFLRRRRNTTSTLNHSPQADQSLVKS